MADQHPTLEQAIYQVLTSKQNGRGVNLSILAEPRRFYSVVVDIAGTETRESAVLGRACSEGHYLSYFEQASRRGTSEALTEAVKKASMYLINADAIDAGVAYGISNAMASALARSMGIGQFNPVELPYRQSPVWPNNCTQKNTSTDAGYQQRSGVNRNLSNNTQNDNDADLMPPDDTAGKIAKQKKGNM